jgi:hypothetical protein
LKGGKYSNNHAVDEDEKKTNIKYFAENKIGL